MIHQQRQDCQKLDLLCRIYSVQIEGKDVEYWASTNRSPDEFRDDMRDFSSEFKNLDPDTLFFHLKAYLSEKGYLRVADLVSDRFVGRIISTRSRILED